MSVIVIVKRTVLILVLWRTLCLHRRDWYQQLVFLCSLLGHEPVAVPVFFVLLRAKEEKSGVTQFPKDGKGLLFLLPIKSMRFLLERRSIEKPVSSK